jgi:hypothetical protein
MSVIVGNSNRLNYLKGCSQLLSFDSSQSSILVKVFPANMIIKDSFAGGLYLTDGIHDVQWVMEHNELLCDAEMSATEVSNIAASILD